MGGSAIAFQSQKLSLEGVVTIPQGRSGDLPMVVVCHPHPLFQGDMDHPLGLAICAALDKQGVATLRFNVRGVGGSQGEFTNGQEELTDIESALKVASRWPRVASRRIGLVSYSFSAALLLRGLERFKRTRALVLISPPPNAAAGARPARLQHPPLVLVGEDDRIAPPSRIQELMGSVAPGAQIQVVEGASHTWHGYEETATKRVVQFLAQALR